MSLSYQFIILCMVFTVNLCNLTIVCNSKGLFCGFSLKKKVQRGGKKWTKSKCHLHLTYHIYTYHIYIVLTCAVTLIFQSPNTGCESTSRKFVTTPVESRAPMICLILFVFGSCVRIYFIKYIISNVSYDTFPHYSIIILKSCTLLQFWCI